MACGFNAPAYAYRLMMSAVADDDCCCAANSVRLVRNPESFVVVVFVRIRSASLAMLSECSTASATILYY